MERHEIDLIAEAIGNKVKDLISPVSQGMMFEIKEQLEQRIDDGHGRLRESFNELREGLRESYKSIMARYDTIDAELNELSKKLYGIERERMLEQEALRTKRQDQRDHATLVAMIAATVTTVVLFIAKALLHL